MILLIDVHDNNEDDDQVAEDSILIIQTKSFQSWFTLKCVNAAKLRFNKTKTSESCRRSLNCISCELFAPCFLTILEALHRPIRRRAPSSGV